MNQWNDEQQALRDAITAMGGRLSEGHIEQDRLGEFSREKWDVLRRTGLFGLPFDEAYGGLGQDLLTTMFVLEGLGYSCRDAGLNFSASTQIVAAGVPLHRFGSAELKQRYLPGICDGSVIAAHAITEPGGGSDVMSMRTTARADGDDYVLDGSKVFISNGPIADLVIVYARTGKPRNPAGLTAFAVDAGTPGLSVGKQLDTMGLRNAPLSEVFLDGCRVPRSNMVGSAGAGFLVLDHVMKWEILCGFSVTVGEMQHRLERCLDYARTRTQFGSSIGSFQLTSSKIVDMKIGVEESRRWLFGTAEKLLDKKNIAVDLAITKLVTSENNVSSALAAIQLFGGHGYMTEMGIEKDLRNAVAGTIYSGTSEVQRQRIATLIGL